jgi:hypothetical protein
MATTTNYGFEIPDDTDLVKDGALAMRDLGQDVDTQLFTALGGDYPGLRLIKTQTIGTSVSSVSITNAFSATYDSYKIIIEGGSMTSDGDLSLNLTGSTASYAYGLVYLIYGSSTVLGFQSASASSYVPAGHGLAGNGLTMNLDIGSPFLAKYTTFRNNVASNSISGNASGVHKVATSYTGLTLTSNLPITGGTIYVYGYGAS